MKAIRFTIMLLLTLILGCQTHADLSGQQKAIISKEIEASLNQIMDGWNTNTIKTAFPVFVNDQNFTMIGIDGSMINYSSLMDMSKQMFEMVKSARYTLLENILKIINENVVVALGTYSCEITNPDGKWTVTHFHESSLASEVAELSRGVA